MNPTVLLPRISGSIRVADNTGRNRLYRNLMVSTGRYWMLDRWLPSPSTAAALTYIAVGDADTSPALGQVSLGNEVARVAITSQIRDALAYLAEGFFDRADANFNWKEVGLIAGGNASVDTGIMVARALLNEDKDDLRTVTVTWELEVTQD